MRKELSILLKDLQDGKISADHAESQILGWVDELNQPTRTPVDGDKSKAELFLAFNGIYPEANRHSVTYDFLLSLLTDFASRPVSNKTVYVEIASTESRPDSYEPYLIFKTEADETDFKNRYTELVCDMLLNHNGQGVFGSAKMQQIADLIHRPVVTDADIYRDASDYVTEQQGNAYTSERNTSWQYNDVVNAYEAGAKAMREKMGGSK